MVSHRLNGFINLHLAVATCLAFLLFAVMAGLEGLVLGVSISPDLSPLPYLLCVALGMGLSARFVHHASANFHRPAWTTAAWLTTRQVTLVAVMLFAFMFAFKDRAMSRLFVGTYLVLCWFLLVLINYGLPQLLASVFFQKGRRMATLLVGSSRSFARMRSWIHSKRSLGFDPVGYVALHEEVGRVDEPDVTKLGELTDLPRILSESQIMQVMMLELPPRPEDGQLIISACQEQGCRLLIYSNLSEQFRHPLVTVDEHGHQFYTLQTEPLEDPLHRVLKRVFDVSISLPVVLFVLPPLFVTVWLVQRFQSPGPVLFSQLRTGHNQRPFRLLKFRSMRTDNREEAKQATKGDARIYPFGRLLRRTSLDEFPQFWNVLVGDMSVVGPRPHMMAHDNLFATQMKAYRTRFFVKPGITGLAQCNGLRGEITDPALLEKRVACDIAYVSGWSIWLDVQLVFRTAWQVLFPPKSAY
jgi:exopolysaccharide biosynthesis polyprenyl glycosylphosphotransferase